MESTEANLEPEKAAARSAGLTYVSDTSPGIRRKRSGTGFSYSQADGSLLKDPDTLKRIRALAVPPAWSDVWICSKANGHIQATGRDDRGRKQYKYHPHWREVRDLDKYEHMLEFAALLPRLRSQVEEDLAKRGVPREKVLATVVSLLDKALVRVGNPEYAKENGSYGLTTLRTRHVEIAGTELRFHFKGKSGKTWRLKLKDRRIARVIRSIQELPGQDLFQYVDEAGEIRSITSSDVNDYLREVTGKDISAKDFRTWAGTVLAAMALTELGAFENKTQAKTYVRRAIEAVATRLGNTATICRKCYVHPEIIACYLEGTLPAVRANGSELRRSGLPREENAVMRLLKRRLIAARRPKNRGAEARAAP